MSSQAWALAGVVVGAVLGGLAQVVAGGLQRRHDRHNNVRELQRVAYLGFLAAAMDFMAAAGNAQNEEDRAREVVAVPEAALGQLQRLDAALLAVQLVAPHATFDAAHRVYARALEIVMHPHTDPVDGSTLAFLAAAKSDLGLP